MNQARSRAIDRVRFEQRKKRVDPFPDVIQEEPFQDAGALHELRQLGQELRGALVVLNADERAAIEAAYFGENSYAQVAALLEQPLGTIKTRIRSGLAKLRQALGQEGRGP
jgi:RNA polymerase sigma-70 factor, ECF subfamily